MNLDDETAKYHQEIARRDNHQKIALKTVQHHLKGITTPTQTNQSKIPCSHLQHLLLALQDLDPLPGNIASVILNILDSLPAIYGPTSILDTLASKYINHNKKLIEINDIVTRIYCRDGWIQIGTYECHELADPATDIVALVLEHCPLEQQGYDDDEDQG